MYMPRLIFSHLNNVDDFNGVFPKMQTKVYCRMQMYRLTKQFSPSYIFLFLPFISLFPFLLNPLFPFIHIISFPSVFFSRGFQSFHPEKNLKFNARFGAFCCILATNLRLFMSTVSTFVWICVKIVNSNEPWQTDHFYMSSCKTL